MKHEEINFKESGIFFKYFEGETTIHENELILNWINKSPENKLFFQEVEALWKGTDISVLNEKYNPGKGWDKMEKKLSEVESPNILLPQSRKKIKIYLKTFLRIAAIIVLFIGIWQLYTITQKEIIVQSFDTTQKHILPDGSEVVLNNYSEIKYSKGFNKKTRNIELEGEAFFEVQKNKEIPFIIFCGKAKIEVTGTSFNVNTKQDGKVEVIVETGKVKVMDIKDKKEEYIFLTKGEKGIVFMQNDSIEKSINTNPNFDAWKTGVLIFENTKMTDVVKVIEDVFHITVSLDENLKNCELIAKFDNQPLDNVLEIIKCTFNLTIDKNNNIICIKGEGCN